MEIGSGGVMKIAEMICGDDPFDYFPYRSSSKLTRFFVDLDFDYVHDGSTRRHWVNDALKELNTKRQMSADMPSQEMVKVIENLLHPEHFQFDKKVDRDKAKDAVVACLRTYDLTIKEQPNGQITVCPLHGKFVSTDHKKIPHEQIIIFKPTVFHVPEKEQDDKLISVMMPFEKAFDPTYDAVERVVDHMSYKCLRADSIWDNSTFIQDIFDLIYCSRVVVVDFTGRNSNVMYETGIAHTLGKTVIPITQSIQDIPSDLGHHRAFKYLPNKEGYRDLSNELFKRLKTILKIP